MSGRHTSGFALRFPRIVRLRDDKPPEEINTLADVQDLYRRTSGASPRERRGKERPSGA